MDCFASQCLYMYMDCFASQCLYMYMSQITTTNERVNSNNMQSVLQILVLQLTSIVKYQAC